MPKTQICQSCAMPIVSPTLQGTYKNRNKTKNYCKYCYKDGKFLDNFTMTEMIEFCIPYYSHNNPYENKNEARKYLPEVFRRLKRWRGC